jgi:hypothetical protein
MGNQLDDGFSPSKLSLLTVNVRYRAGCGRWNKAAIGQQRTATSFRYSH